MTTDDRIDVYRIGWWTHRWWPSRDLLAGVVTGKVGGHRVGRRALARVTMSRLRLIRRPHRPWQAEYDGCRWARRSLTMVGAYAAAATDREFDRAGYRSPWVARKVRRRAERAAR